MSSKFIYYYRRLNSQGQSLVESPEAGVARAAQDIARRIEPLRITHIDGMVILNREQLVEQARQLEEE